jgi:transcription initiation factor TFIIIB Brf1 subunit/transcription initiation factor TFIIB
MEGNIISEISRYPFPEDVKLAADEIHKKMKRPISRGKNRKQMLAVCVYYAYCEKGIWIDPVEITNIMNMDKETIHKGLSTFSEINTGYRPIIINSTPMDFLDSFCEKLGFDDEHKVKCIQICKEAIEKERSVFKNSYPKKIAAGALKLFLEMENIPYKIESLSTITDSSPTTIQSTYKKISMAYNKD